MANLPKLDKQFIEGLVQQPVDNFDIKKGSEKGDNIAGDIFSIQANTSSNKVWNLVYKVLPASNPMLRQFGIENRVFELEMHLYTTVAEKVQELIQNFGKDSTLRGIPVPRYFGGLCDGENSYLVLEDERPNGFRMSNKYRGYNLDEASIILKELARFHAFTHFLIRHEGEQFFSSKPGLERYAKGFWNDNSNPENEMVSQAMFGSAFNLAMKVIEDKIGDPSLATRVKNKIKFEDIGDIVRQTGRLTDREIFPVISHGDLWTNNILLKYDPASGAPTAAKFIDFQQIRRGNIYEDLLYLVYTSTTPEFRKQNLAQILHIYFKEFTSILDELACPVPSYFTEGFFIDTFYSGLIPIYLYMLYSIPFHLGKHDDPGPSISMGPVDKEAAFAFLFATVEKLYSSTQVTKRLESLTREFVDLKLF